MHTVMTPTPFRITAHSPSTMSPSKVRVALFFSSIVDLDAYTCLVEIVAQAKVVLRRTSIDSVYRNIRPKDMDIMLVDAAMVDVAEAQQLAEFAKGRNVRAALIGAPEGSQFAAQAKLPIVANSRDLMRLLLGQSVEPAIGAPINETVETPALTRREREVWRLISTGQSVRDIASTLNLAESTIDSHKSRLMRKLQVHKSVDLVRLAAKLGLMEQ